MRFLPQLKSLSFNILFAIIGFVGFLAFDIVFDFSNDSYSFSLWDVSDRSYAIYFFTFLFLSFSRKWVIALFLSLIAISSLSQMLFIQYFGTYLPPIGFYQIYLNLCEVSETFFAKYKLMLTPILIGVILSIAFGYPLLKLQSKGLKSWFPIIIVVLIIVGDNVIIYNWLRPESGKIEHSIQTKLLPTQESVFSINYQRSLQFFLWGILPKKILGTAEQYPNADVLEIKHPKPQKTIVLVIGETLRAKQLSVLGYEKDTTPLLAKIEDLYASKIISAGTMTKTSVSALINRMEYPGVTSQISKQTNCLFKLASDNGFQTHLLSAQNKNQMKLLDTLVCKKYIKNYQVRDAFDRTISPYDIALLDQIKAIDFTQNNFIVLHQRGSHSPYEKQSPPEYKIFESSYDNTVYYTDFVLNSFIDELSAKAQGELHFIYTSDHGEILNEHDMNGHGWFFEEVYEVPFLYKEHNVVNSELNHAKKVLSHFDVSNFVANLLGYDVEVDASEKRVIYVNGSDIDALAGHLKLTVENGVITNKEQRE